MPKYIVTSSLTVGCYTEVDASNPQGAKEKALRRSVTALAHNAQLSSATQCWVLSGPLCDSEVCDETVEVTNPETGEIVEVPC